MRPGSNNDDVLTGKALMRPLLLAFNKRPSVQRLAQLSNAPLLAWRRMNGAVELSKENRCFDVFEQSFKHGPGNIAL